MKRDEQIVLLTTLIISYLGQIHATLLEIMGRVGEESATIEVHNKVIKELQEEQEEIVKELKKYGS